jgi:hypothetical protein
MSLPDERWLDDSPGLPHEIERELERLRAALRREEHPVSKEALILDILVVMLGIEVYAALEGRKVIRLLEQILNRLPNVPASVKITQLGANNMPAGTNSIVAGTTGVFGEIFAPSGSVPPASAVSTWTSSDPTVTLTPSTDTLQSSVAAAVPAGNTASFTLSLSVAFNDGSGTVLTASQLITVTPSAPTVPTAVSISQLS